MAKKTYEGFVKGYTNIHIEPNSRQATEDVELIESQAAFVSAVSVVIEESERREGVNIALQARYDEAMSQNLLEEDKKHLYLHTPQYILV